MKHHKRSRTLGRTKRQRTALMRSMARSLIVHGAITTTLARAKELRPYIERLVTHSKTDTPAARRLIAARLGNSREALAKLRSEYASRFAKRSGGYTRITHLGKTGKRTVESARIEFLQ